MRSSTALSLTGLLAIAHASPALPIPALPVSLPTLPGVPPLPVSLPAVPGVPALPVSVPSVPGVPALPISVPSLPGVPALPISVPGVPALPTGIPVLPGVPGLPSLPLSLPVPGGAGLPSLPVSLPLPGTGVALPSLPVPTDLNPTAIAGKLPLPSTPILPGGLSPQDLVAQILLESQLLDVISALLAGTVPGLGIGLATNSPIVQVLLNEVEKLVGGNVPVPVAAPA